MINLKAEDVRKKTDAKIDHEIEDELKKALPAFSDERIEKMIEDTASARKYECKVEYGSIMCAARQDTSGNWVGKLPDRLNQLVEELEDAGFGAKWSIEFGKNGINVDHILYISWKRPPVE